jgi:hypothetical protein
LIKTSTVFPLTGETIIGDYSQTAITSYLANAQVFRPHFTLAHSFPDGLSQTIWFAEAYACCHEDCNDLNGRMVFADEPILHREIVFGIRWDQVHPIVEGNPPEARPSRPNATFQVRPLVGKSATPLAPGVCDRSLPQTPHSGGMLLGMGDGGVRTVAPGVRPSVFWGMVTPSGGEVIATDW